jgi:hypothetical protein
MFFFIMVVLTVLENKCNCVDALKINLGNKKLKNVERKMLTEKQQVANKKNSKLKKGNKNEIMPKYL